MPALATDIQAYLHEVLGISVPLYRPWSEQAKLPYFLQDAFDFGEIDLLGRSILLVMERDVGPSTIGEIRSRLDKVQSLSDKPAIYVTKTLASFQRKRLIEQKVSFIVPGNQLYLPDLGIDLREYFRQRPNRTVPTLSPSAQAILIAALLRPNSSSSNFPGERKALCT